MRHGIVGNKLSRFSSFRKATVRDIAKATLIHQRVCTTKAKAMEARKLVDKLITLGKKGKLSHQRRAFSILCHQNLVSDLFKKTAPRFKDRQGGYTRIIPFRNRRGDNAHLVFLELTEKDEALITKKKAAHVAKSEKPQKIPAKDVEPSEQKKAETKEMPAARPHKEDAAKIADKKTPSHEKDVKPKFGGLRSIFKKHSRGQ